MSNIISFKEKYGAEVQLVQDAPDGTMTIKVPGGQTEISGEDMVKLLNYYMYIKDTDTQNSFINPEGHNSDTVDKNSVESVASLFDMTCKSIMIQIAGGSSDPQEIQKALAVVSQALHSLV